MGDGAHLGVKAERALNAIFGGPQPTEEERLEQAEFAAWIQSAPHNLKDIKGEDAYSEASRWLARRYLLILQQAPAIDRDTAWEVFKVMWPDDTDEAGGMTGFMHGWGWNAALYSLSRPPQPNPAILTIGLKKPSLWKRIALYRLVCQLWDRRYDWLKIDLSQLS